MSNEPCFKPYVLQVSPLIIEFFWGLGESEAPMHLGPKANLDRDGRKIYKLPESMKIPLRVNPDLTWEAVKDYYLERFDGNEIRRSETDDNYWGTGKGYYGTPEEPVFPPRDDCDNHDKDIRDNPFDWVDDPYWFSPDNEWWFENHEIAIWRRGYASDGSLAYFLNNYRPINSWLGEDADWAYAHDTLENGNEFQSNSPLWPGENHQLPNFEFHLLDAWPNSWSAWTTCNYWSKFHRRHFQPSSGKDGLTPIINGIDILGHFGGGYIFGLDTGQMLPIKLWDCLGDREA